jgi:hypothetical protein
MAQKTFFNTPWGDRGGVEKIALIVGGGIAIYVGWRSFKNISNFLRSKISQVQAGSELGALQSQNVLPNYTNTQYGIFADALQTAMGSWYDGTDEEAIKVIMQKMKNDADVLKLNTVFGTREGYTLSGWFRYEMSDDYVNYYVNEPLKRNGITFQF